MAPSCPLLQGWHQPKRPTSPKTLSFLQDGPRCGLSRAGESRPWHFVPTQATLTGNNCSTAPRRSGRALWNVHLCQTSFWVRSRCFSCLSWVLVPNPVSTSVSEECICTAARAHGTQNGQAPDLQNRSLGRHGPKSERSDWRGRQDSTCSQSYKSGRSSGGSPAL